MIQAYALSRDSTQRHHDRFYSAGIEQNSGVILSCQYNDR